MKLKLLKDRIKIAYRKYKKQEKKTFTAPYSDELYDILESLERNYYTLVDLESRLKLEAKQKSLAKKQKPTKVRK